MTVHVERLNVVVDRDFIGSSVIMANEIVEL